MFCQAGIRDVYQTLTNFEHPPTGLSAWANTCIEPAVKRKTVGEFLKNFRSHQFSGLKPFLSTKKPFGLPMESTRDLRRACKSISPRFGLSCCRRRIKPFTTTHHRHVGFPPQARGLPTTGMWASHHRHVGFPPQARGLPTTGTWASHHRHVGFFLRMCKSITPQFQFLTLVLDPLPASPKSPKPGYLEERRGSPPDFGPFP